MEKKQAQRKIKSIIPQRVWINKEHIYVDFIKKRYKVLPKLDLKKSENEINSRLKQLKFFESLDSSLLIKVFKTLKYARELDLSNMFPWDKPYSPSKTIYFAKRMSNAQVIRIPDLKKLTENFKGQSEFWMKYAKKAQVFGYSCDLCYYRTDPNLFNQSSNGSTFVHLIRYQPQIKDLTVQFYLRGQLLPEAYFNFERYPPHLERLSLRGIMVDKDVPSLIHHLKSLKHFEISFHAKATSVFIFVLIKQLALLSNLQSLALSMKQDPSLVFSKKTSFKSLVSLRLCFQSEIANLANILGAFTECPLRHLRLRAKIKSDHEFIQIANFIANYKKLERLQLKIICWDEFRSWGPLTQLLHQIDGLPLLTRLSVSIFPLSRFKFSQKATLPFAQLFTKPVLLKSLKLYFQGFIVSKQDFLQLLKTLERYTLTLRKLRIDIGKCELNQIEFRTVLRFIKSFPKIRSLQFRDLRISSEYFLKSLAEAVDQLPYLEKFAVGKISDEQVRETILISTVERILKKRGLRKFFCCVSYFYYKNGPFDKSLRLNLATIQKINPYLEKFPDIPIFDMNDYDIDI